jgi:spermidine synthase
VLILGGGDGLAAREVLKYPGVESVLLVDLDPVVTALAATQPDLVALNHGAFADARMDRRSGTGVSPAGTEPLLLDSHLERRLLDGSSYEVAEVAVRNLDADAFIRQAEDHYDLVIIDFPDPSQLELCKLYSREFYLALRTRLAPGAMLAIQSTSPEHAPLVFRCIGQTLAASGFSTVPYQHNVPSFGQWGWHLAWADDRSTQSVLDSLGPSAGPMAVDTQALTPSLLAAACVFPKGVLEGEAVGVNTKMRPVILDYFRRSWSQR